MRLVRRLQTPHAMTRPHTPSAVAFLGQAKKSLGDDLGNLRLELEQIRSLLNDAIETLQKSFFGLVEKTTGQRRLVESLLSSGRDVTHVSLKTLVGEVEILLQRLTADLTTAASLETDSAKRMESLVRELEGTFSLLSKLDGIAAQTNILAINAYIEAARSGDRGRAFGVVAAEVRALSKVSRELNDSMSDNVHNARAVIVDVSAAVQGMGTRGAAAANEAGSRGQAMLGRLAAFDKRMVEVLAALDKFAVDVEERAGAAIRALQFEDMVRQLLECSTKRIARMEAVVASMDVAASGDEDALITALADLDRAEAMHLRSPVAQESMQGGSVELF